MIQQRCGNCKRFCSKHHGRPYCRAHRKTTFPSLGKDCTDFEPLNTSLDEALDEFSKKFRGAMETYNDTRKRELTEGLGKIIDDVSTEHAVPVEARVLLKERVAKYIAEQFPTDKQED